MNINRNNNEEIKLKYKVKALGRIHSKFITMISLYVFVVIIAIAMLITNTDAAYKTVFNSDIGLAVKVVKAFDTSINAYYTDFTSFPIGSWSIYMSADHFCAQRGVNWATASSAVSYGVTGASTFHIHPSSVYLLRSSGDYKYINGIFKSFKKGKGKKSELRVGDLNEATGQLDAASLAVPVYSAVENGYSGIHVSSSFGTSYAGSTTWDGYLDGYYNEDGKLTFKLGWFYDRIPYSYDSGYFPSEGGKITAISDDGSGVVGYDGPHHNPGSGYFYSFPTHGNNLVSNMGYAYIIATMKQKSASGDHPDHSENSEDNAFYHGPNEYAVYENDEMQLITWNWFGRSFDSTSGDIGPGYDGEGDDYDYDWDDDWGTVGGLDLVGEGEGASTTSYSCVNKNTRFLDAAKKSEDYNKKSRNPKLYAQPDQHVGTEINDGNTEYAVGPFKMSKYYRAKDEKIYDNDGNHGVEYQGTTYYNVQDLFNSERAKDNSQTISDENDTKGDLIEVRIVLTGENGDSSQIKLTKAFKISDGEINFNDYYDVENHPESLRGQEFAVAIDASTAKGYDELKEIIFVYQRIGVKMDGMFYNFFNGSVDVTPTSQETSDCIYYGYCDSCGTYRGTKTEGGPSLTVSECTHIIRYDDPDDEDEDGDYEPVECGCTTADFKCRHSHYECKETEYTFGNISSLHNRSGGAAQNAFTCGAELIPEQIEFIEEVNVPMKTRLAVTKAIVQTLHNQESDIVYDVFGEGERDDSRLRKLDSLAGIFNKTTETMSDTSDIGYGRREKCENYLRVERGDNLYYEVKVKNDSRFPTQFKLKDLFYQDLSTYPDAEHPVFIYVPKGSPEYSLSGAQGAGLIKLDGDVSTELSSSEASEWITIEAGKTLTFYVKELRPTKDSGIYTNRVEFATKNHGTTDKMRYVEWADHSSYGGYDITWYGSKQPNTKGNIVNIYAYDILYGHDEPDGDERGKHPLNLEEDSDTYRVKEYHLDVEKYIYDVEHKYTEDSSGNRTYLEAYDLAGIDTTFDASDNRSYVLHEGGSITSEADKEEKPVYAEYGDIITYYIDVYNTNDYFCNDRTVAPFHQPNKAYVDLKDTLPDNISNLKASLIYYDNDVYWTGDAIMGNTSTVSGNSGDLRGAYNKAKLNGVLLNDTLVDIPGVTGGDISVEDLMVPPGNRVTLKLVLTTEERTRDEDHENKVEIVGEKRNINYGPDHTGADIYCVVLDHGKDEDHYYSSDWFILNEYHTVITKYLYDYEPLMTTDNNSKGFTRETNDAYIADLKNRIRLTYTEQEKYNHPLNVEKNEYVTWNIQVSNLSQNEPVEGRDEYRDISNPGKPNTQVRPTKVLDYLQVGLELQSSDVYGTIYTLNDDGTVGAKVTRYGEGDIPVTINGPTLTRHSLDESTPLAMDREIYDNYEDQQFNKYEILLDDKYILNPNECIIYTLRAKVTKSNMYLYRLENVAKLGILTNINCEDPHNRIVKEEDEDYGENVAGRTVHHQNDQDKYYIGTKETRDYVKMKDLVIAGKVWIDNKANGLYENTGTTLDDDVLKEDIKVILYAFNGLNYEVYRETRTDANGLYTFGKDFENENEPQFYSAYEYTIAGRGGYSLANPTPESEPTGDNIVSYESRQRVPKTKPIDIPFTLGGYGTFRDTAYKNTFLNYTRDAAAIPAQYYVEFEYDGLYYKATDLYAYRTNLSEEGNDRWTPLSMENGVISTDNSKKYINDSNAFEFWDDREAFDKKFETIGYDIAYGGNGHNATSYSDYNLLEYEKKATFTTSDFRNGDYDESLEGNSAHISQLLERPHVYLEQNRARVMTARSFIHGDPLLDVARSQDYTNTDMLFLFSFDETGDTTIPETEYLKYINLGLVKREKVDISLVKDVYQVKVTINGEEIIYQFDEVGVPTLISGNEGKLYQLENELRDTYNIELYESDYNYRYENYTAQAVRDYKTELSEMNVEVTYKIKVINNSVVDYDTEYTGEARDIPLFVKINEIADYYDDNFMEYTDGIEASDSSVGWYHGLTETKTGFSDSPTANYMQMKKKFGDFIRTEKVKIAEAWYYTGNVTTSTRNDLELHNTSNYNAKRTVDGYNTLFIRGLEDVKLYEKGANNNDYYVDVYVKYVVDKGDDFYQTGNNVLETLRQLKIFEKQGGNSSSGTALTNGENESKENADLRIIDLGIEGIAEINAYSTYYVEESRAPGFYNIRYNYKHYAGKPAGTVDRDSNPSNIGETATPRSAITGVPNLSSVIPFGSNPGEAAIYYEDDTFKTGVKFKLPGDTRIRTISGLVWDDTRNEYVEDDDGLPNKQYGGNGKYEENVIKDSTAKANENIENLYEQLDDDSAYKSYLAEHNEANTFNDTSYENEDAHNLNYEKADFLVNDVKTKLIEIVKVPVDNENNVTEIHYYEEPAKIRKAVGAELELIETKSGSADVGKYELSGFVPGYYIVRFFYGYNEGNNDPSLEMLTYNGQDYKSTKYDVKIPDYDDPTGQKQVELDNFTLNTGAKYDYELERVLYGYDDRKTEDAEIDNVKLLTTTMSNSYEDDSIGISSESKAIPPSFATRYDDVLKALTDGNNRYNDARDDEVSRLNAMGYSEVVTNAKAELLKGISSRTQYLDQDAEDHYEDSSANPASYTMMKVNLKETGDNPILIQTKKEMNRELVENTAMNAETVTFYVKPERVNPDTIYAGREVLAGQDRADRNDGDYKIENIDFGITYRPEAQMTIDKSIETIKITTSDNEDIMKIAFKDKLNDSNQVVIDQKTGRMARTVDLENSIGLDKLQYLFNDDMLPAQGFFYINIDDEILQGCKIGIEYAIRGENISEIDRISSNLDILRYKENVSPGILSKVSDGYIYNTDLTNPLSFAPYENTMSIKYDVSYSGSKTAQKLLYQKYYEKDLNYDGNGNSGYYRRADKTMTKDENNKYYGSFLGGAYFNNEVLKTVAGEDIDTYVDLKIDKILDYIDNDLVFNQESNNSENHRWMPVTAEYLYTGDTYNGRYIKNTSLFKEEGYEYNPDGSITAPDGIVIPYEEIESHDIFDIYDIEEISYEKHEASNLVVSIDDRVVDDKYTVPKMVSGVGTSYDGKTDMITSMQNVSLSRYLEPRINPSLKADVVNAKGMSPDYKTNEYNLNVKTGDQYAGKIKLTAERVVSAETDTENLAFENIAEIIQYSVTNGRRTNFKTTLGDAEVKNPDGIYEESLTSHRNDPEYPDDPKEEIETPKDPDTSSVELITLSPPTGLDRIQRIVKNAVRTTTRIVIPIGVGLAMAGIVMCTLAVVRTKGKKRIK